MSGASLESEALGRLAQHSLVQELSSNARRLQYRLIEF